MTEEEFNKECRKRSYSWATDDQWECLKLLADLRGGFHHISSKQVKPWAEGIRFLCDGEFATFDFNYMTLLVLACHERCIRGALSAAGMRTSLTLHRRHAREGSSFDYHPTIEQAIERYRKTFPLEAK